MKGAPCVIATRSPSSSSVAPDTCLASSMLPSQLLRPAENTSQLGNSIRESKESGLTGWLRTVELGRVERVDRQRGVRHGARKLPEDLHHPALFPVVHLAPLPGDPAPIVDRMLRQRVEIYRLGRGEGPADSVVALQPAPDTRPPGRVGWRVIPIAVQPRL